MHLGIIFENIGGYHAARLRAVAQACALRKWSFTAIQVTETQAEHPWGELEKSAAPFPIVTVLSTRAHSIPQDEMDSAARRIPAVLEELNPDVLAIPGWGFSYSRAALRWCQKRDVPAILMSDSKRDDEKRSLWKELLKSRLYVRKFDAALVAGSAHRDYLEELGMPREKIFTGYDVVDNEHFSRAAQKARSQPALARARQPAIPTAPFFLAVTRFVPRKNVPLLVRAFAKYRAQASHPWDLAICGSGSDEAAVRESIAHENLRESVHLPGFLRYDEIGDWYGLASAFVHVALAEQWGLVVNEAMAAGLPVIVSQRCGCYPDLVRGAGLGFDPANEDELADCLLKMSDGATDRAAMSAASLEQVQKFTPDDFAKGMLSAVGAASEMLTQ